MRIILYTGKGGVGKTTIAASTACEIAKKGKKVLVVSTDMAHSLSDAFEMKLEAFPTPISENLEGMEIDVVAENEKGWGTISEYFKKLLSTGGKGDIESEELLVFPGFEELLSLLKIREIYEQGKYDVLIVDCAPTGETMSLLKFPGLFRWWMERLWPIKRKGTKLIKPVMEKVSNIPLPEDEVFEEVEKLYVKVEELEKLMANKEVVSLRIVTTPEKIVVREAKRNFSYLHLYGYNVDSIVVNKVWNKEAIEGYFNKWLQLQDRALKEIQESFNGIPIFSLEFQKNEVKGCTALEKIGEKLYKEQSPEKVLFKDKIFEVREESEEAYLRLYIPFVEKRELSLLQKGDELLVGIKNEKRNLILPNKLQGKAIVKAKYNEEGKCLNIYFK